MNTSIALRALLKSRVSRSPHFSFANVRFYTNKSSIAESPENQGSSENDQAAKHDSDSLSIESNPNTSPETFNYTESIPREDQNLKGEPKVYSREKASIKDNIFDADSLLFSSSQKPATNRDMPIPKTISEAAKTSIPSIAYATDKPGQTRAKPGQSSTLMKQIIQNRDREQIFLSQISMCRDINDLSNFVVEKMFPEPQMALKGQAKSYNTESKGSLLLGQKRLELKMVLSSAIVASAVSMARQMRSIDLVLYIYDKVSMLPSASKLDCFQTESCFELIKSVWELNRDLHLVLKLLRECIVLGVEFDNDFLDLIDNILAEIKDKPRSVSEFTQLKSLTKRARLLMV